MNGLLPADHPGYGGRIGPNAVIQLGHAVSALLQPAAAADLYDTAGLGPLLDAPPEEMIDQDVPAALFQTLWQLFPDQAPLLAADAGRRTADYVIANRIPRIARRVFLVAPRQVGTWLLLKAISRNAWTFVGSGKCETHFGRPSLISITDNPLMMPECIWNTAVFERLFDRLVAQGTRVLHTANDGNHPRICEFKILLPVPSGSAR